MIMSDTAITIILSLIGFLQTIFIFLLAYIFKMIGTLFNRLDSHKKEDKEDKADLEKKMTDLLDNHYVTTGQLSTLEEKLIGKINGLTNAIEGLTSIIKAKL